MDATSSAYRRHLENHLPALVRNLDTAERIKQLLPHVLALALLDLEPARERLAGGYAGRKGGRPPRDPVAMLRSIVLMLMTGETRINEWARRLKGRGELRVLSGFDPAGRPPGVGTFYDFFKRLLDGPYQPRCAHHEPPSERLSGAQVRAEFEG